MSRLVEANAPIVFELADAALVIERASWPVPQVRAALESAEFRGKPREVAALEFFATVELWARARPGLRLFWKDASQRYLGASDSLGRDTGLTSGGALFGKQDSDEDIVWRRQAAKYNADDRRVIEEGEPRLDFLERLDTGADATLWVRTSKAPVVHRGKVVATMGVFEVISLEQAKALQRSIALGVPSSRGSR